MISSDCNDFQTGYGILIVIEFFYESYSFMNSSKYFLKGVFSGVLTGLALKIFNVLIHH